jgi:hypothetical protein
VKDRLLLKFLVATGTFAVAVLAVIFVVSASEDRASLREELGKAMIQIIVVVVIGTGLKLLVDRHQALAQRAEQDQHFRQEKYDLLVGVTNSLRRVPVLIDANRSVKTWSAQMTAVMDSGLQLRSLKHQIYSSRVLDDPAFSSHAELTDLLETMYHYTDWVVEDFAKNKKRLSELQLAAEGTGSNPADRAVLQERIWDELKELDSIKDMRADIDAATRGQRRREITHALRAPSTDGNRLAGLKLSWLTYLECESVALELMTQAALARPERLALPKPNSEPPLEAVVEDALDAP